MKVLSRTLPTTGTTTAGVQCFYCGEVNPRDSTHCRGCGTPTVQSANDEVKAVAAMAGFERQFARRLLRSRRDRAATAMTLGAPWSFLLLGGLLISVFAGFSLLGARSAFSWGLLGAGASASIQFGVLSSVVERGWRRMRTALNWQLVEAATREVGPECEGSAADTRGSVFSLRLPSKALGAMCVGAGVFVVLVAGWFHQSREVPLRLLYERQVVVGILVKGKPRFQKEVCDALELLRERNPARYCFVVDRIGAVVEGNNDAVNIWVIPAVIDFSEPPISDLTWCAGGLVHEAMHVELLQRSRLLHGGGCLLGDVSGTNSEIQANQPAMETLIELGAPPTQVETLAEDRGAHIKTRYGERIAAEIEARAATDMTIYYPVPLSNSDSILGTEVEMLRRAHLEKERVMGRAAARTTTRQQAPEKGASPE